MVTSQKIENWIKRKNRIEVYDAYKDTAKTFVKREISHQYWICDYCGSAIVIKSANNRILQDGGEFDLPSSRTGRGKIRVVTHTSCLNKLLKELDEYREVGLKQ